MRVCVCVCVYVCVWVSVLICVNECMRIEACELFFFILISISLYSFFLRSTYYTFIPYSVSQWPFLFRHVHTCTCTIIIFTIIAILFFVSLFHVLFSWQWIQWVPKLETAPKPETIQCKSRKHVNNRTFCFPCYLHDFVIFTESFLVLELFLVLAPTSGHFFKL